MPTQRAHGGAAVLPIPMVSPAMRGLNTEGESSLQDPAWATVLTNAVFDSNGRASLRKGWNSVTTTPSAGTVMRVHEYVKADKTTQTILSTDADILKTKTAPTSILGTLTVTDGNIKFCNFNDKCIALGVGTSGNPAVYTGSGNFTTVTVATGTAPTGGIGTSAFGRLWVTDTDGKTIRYCALLDETKWDTADGGGTIDMSRVWPSGQDEVVAIEELAGDLIIFGRNNTVVWTDGAGSDIGLNPINIYISDTIPGTGCVSQFAVCRAKGDLWFLSYSGLQTMSRALQDKTTPTTNMSKYVQAATVNYTTQEEDKDDITVEYSPAEDFVLLVYPTSKRIQHYDLSMLMEDGIFRTTEWTTAVQTVSYHTQDQELYGSLTGTVGEIMKYQYYSDNGTPYNFVYKSGWLDFGQELNQYLKYVKRITAYMNISVSTTVQFTVNYDFNTNPFTDSIDVVGAQGALWNLSEFSDSGVGIGYVNPNLPANQLIEANFGGGVALRQVTSPGFSGGQFVKIGCNLDTQETAFSLQSINLYAKIGRMA